MGSNLKIGVGLGGTLGCLLIMATGGSFGLALLFVTAVVVQEWLPNVLIYLGALSLTWFLIRRLGKWRAAIASLAATAFLSIAVPVVLNQVAEKRLEQARQLEIQPKEKVKGGGTITIEVPKLITDLGCDELCLVLLFNGQADRVVMQMEGAKIPREYWISRQDCRMDLLAMELMLSPNQFAREWSHSTGASRVWGAVRTRIAAGECLASGEVTHPTGDLRIRWLSDYPIRRGLDFRLEARQPSRHGVEVALRREVIARETVSNVDLLSRPLHIDRAEGWARTSKDVNGKPFDRMAMLRRLTALQLDAPANATLREIRPMLDAALQDPEGSTAAFLLLREYLDSVKDGEFEKWGDGMRISRIILDDRVTFLPYSITAAEKAVPVVRDAVLGRLTRLAARIDDPRQRATFIHFSSLASDLPRGAYSRDVPLLDDLAANVRVRPLMPKLAARLGEQGKGGVEKLVKILEGTPPPTKEEADAIEVGLCGASKDAKEYLGRLRALRGDYTSGDSWRGLLVALGARASEFKRPEGGYQELYESVLEDRSRQCSSISRSN